MAVTAISERLARAASLEPEPAGGFAVLTPFVLADGDHPEIVLRETGRAWQLTDCGTTFMRLGYTFADDQLDAGGRAEAIERILRSGGLSEIDGELVAPVDAGSEPVAVYRFAQSLIELESLALFSTERVRSTFVQDARRTLEALVDPALRTADWVDLEHDPGGLYPIDLMIRASERKLLYSFFIGTNQRLMEAEIAILTHERWGRQFDRLAIIDDTERLPARSLRRLANLATVQFHGLDEGRGQLRSYIRRQVEAVQPRTLTRTPPSAARSSGIV